MTRIKPLDIRKAGLRGSLVRLLLPECRSIDQATLELQWLRDELKSPKRVILGCLLRARRVPLQYILKSQPFGPLLVRCRRGVLIPRWETEEWVCELGSRFAARIGENEMRIVDICTGTGCIALLLRHLIPGSLVFAIDVSKRAISLASENSRSLGLSIKTILQDVLSVKASNILEKHVDLITSNPPYVPLSKYFNECTYSVRNYEPKLALIGDKQFYKNLLDDWIFKTNSFVYEVGDIEQCDYVLKHIRANRELCDVWRVGYRKDTNGQPRVVYGYKKSSRLDLNSVFQGFGEIMH